MPVELRMRKQEKANASNPLVSTKYRKIFYIGVLKISCQDSSDHFRKHLKTLLFVSEDTEPAESASDGSGAI